MMHRTNKVTPLPSKTTTILPRDSKKQTNVDTTMGIQQRCYCMDCRDSSESSPDEQQLRQQQQQQQQQPSMYRIVTNQFSSFNLPSFLRMAQSSSSNSLLSAPTKLLLESRTSSSSLTGESCSSIPLTTSPDTSTTSNSSSSLSSLPVIATQSTFQYRRPSVESNINDNDADADESNNITDFIRHNLMSLTGVEQVRCEPSSSQIIVDHIFSILPTSEVEHYLRTILNCHDWSLTQVISDKNDKNNINTTFQQPSSSSQPSPLTSRAVFQLVQVGNNLNSISNRGAMIADFGLGCRQCGDINCSMDSSYRMASDILLSLPGVENVAYSRSNGNNNRNLNNDNSITLVVDYRPSKISPPDILFELAENGICLKLLASNWEDRDSPETRRSSSSTSEQLQSFKTQPESSSLESAVSQPSSSTTALLRSTFVCARLNSDADCMLIGTVLDPLGGVGSVHYDLPTQQVTVHHEPPKIAATELLELLNDFDMEATLTNTIAMVTSCSSIPTSNGGWPSMVCAATTQETNAELARYGPAAPAAPPVVTMTPTSSCHDTDDDDDDDEVVEEEDDVMATFSSPFPPNRRLAVVVRSTFHCEHLNSELECSLIDELLLSRLDPVYRMGIQDISYSIPFQQVIVEHVPSIITATKIVQLLNNSHDPSGSSGNTAGIALHVSIETDGSTSSGSGGGAAMASPSREETVTNNTTMTDLVVQQHGCHNPLDVNSNHKTTIMTHKCRSVLRVEHICCAAEIPAIRSILKSLPGILHFFVVVATKLVYVEHDLDRITASDVCNALNKARFGAKVKEDGGAVYRQQLTAMAPVATATAVATSVTAMTSLFCLSSFALESRVLHQEGFETAMNTRFDKTQVESFFIEPQTRTLYVNHNPYILTAEMLQESLSQVPETRINLISDGQELVKIDYEALAANAKQIEKEDGSNSKYQSNKCPRPTTVLSGVLWMISMLSLIGGEWEYLRFIGLGSVVFGLPPIAAKSFHQLKHFRFDTNTLMLSASMGALALGEFTEAAAVVFLFAFSEWLEMRATSRVLQALSAIVNLKPEKANLVHHETNELLVVAASAVPTGALVAVKTGEKIPCDGIVMEGNSNIDESSLTGESRPIAKYPGCAVSGGTINSGMSQLLVRTTALAENSAVARLVRLVEEAQANRSETEKMVEEFAKIYTPLVVTAAILMCTIPWAFGRDVGRHWTEIGLVFIVVACPCALIISTPMAYVAGLAAAAQRGVLVKGGAYLETLGRVKNICFDKTGTLTNGEFALLHLEALSEEYSKQEIIQHLVLMEERASHPVANAIIERARNEKIVVPPSMVLKQHALLPGEGVTGTINGKQVHVGNERLFQRLGMVAQVPQQLKASLDSWKQLGGTVGFMSIEGAGIVCAYCAADGVRKESYQVVQNLKKRGIGITMLTGDNEEAAYSVGRQVGLEPHEIQCRLLPEDKLEFMKKVKPEDAALSLPGARRNRRQHVVLFCGDGVNDAPALAAADVGVAMGAGAALAMETADVTLLDSNLKKLETSIQVGKFVIQIIWENIIFCVIMKSIVLAFAIAGKTHLWAAIATDVGSMILVTLNAMTLLGTRGWGLLNDDDDGEDDSFDDDRKGGNKTTFNRLRNVCKKFCDDGRIYPATSYEKIPSEKNYLLDQNLSV